MYVYIFSLVAVDVSVWRVCRREISRLLQALLRFFRVVTFSERLAGRIRHGLGVPSGSLTN